MIAKPLIVGVAGPSNSGKSTLEVGLREVFGDDLSVVSFDDFFVGLDTLPGRTTDNWEHPNLYRWDEYLRVMDDLSQARQARFVPHSYEAKRDGITERVIDPRRVVLVAGFLALHSPDVNKLMRLKLYIDLPPEEMVRRRLARAAGRPSGAWNRPEYINGMLVPATHEFIEPQRAQADYTVDGTKSPTEVRDAVSAIIKVRLSE